MPSGKKNRSSSASGRLEQQSGRSILSELGRRPAAGGRGQKVAPEWLVRESLRWDKRRHSITLGDQPQVIRQQRQQRQHVAESICSVQQSDAIGSFLTEETVSLDSLQKLKSAFEASQSSRPINETEFGQILRKCLALPKISGSQIQGLFKKIDCLDKGRISWGDLCAYMLQESKAGEEAARRRKQAALALPAVASAPGHAAPVVGVHPCRDGTAVTVGEDGVICCWSPELRPQKTKDAFDGGPSIRKSKWASGFTLMTECSKLMMGTGDREIQFHDLSTLSPYCQINALETIPLALNHSCLSLDKYCILYGDAEGCVTVILISCFGDTLRLWNKLPKVGNIPSISMDRAATSPNVTFVRWKVHQDWVTEVKYYEDFQAVVSSSSEESSSVVLGRMLPLTDAEQRLTEIREARREGKARKARLSWTPQLRAPRDRTAFSVNKGVKTFDLCGKRGVLVTGGLDRLVRVWNPHFSGKPGGILKGHRAPISYLIISSEDSQIFSVSADNAVKIWDIQEQHCLLTVDPEESRIHGDITACSYSPATKSLYVAADGMAALSLKIRRRPRGRLVASHEEPVTCCGFCAEFRQVVSCSGGSVVRVWDFDTGRLVFEFGSAHAVTCMTFDLTGRRLITGGKDGCLKIWNYNNGQCLKTLKKDGGCRAVFDCVFLRIHSNFYVMSVGQDRNISIYPDVPADFHHVQKPQPSWQDDQKKGHKEEILCAAHCPPSLLATGSYGGEVIVWDVASGRVQCRFASPSPDGRRRADGLASVTSMAFLRNSEFRRFPMATALVTSGAAGCTDLWSVHCGGEHMGTLKTSRFQEKITKLAKTEKTTLLYAADQIGYIYIYDIKKFAPEQRSLRAERFWRAHTSRVTGLQVVDNDQAVLTSSTDCSVRLWSARGEFIGTFGQTGIWSARVSSSWEHPAVPYEVLVDPLSMANPGVLNMGIHAKDSDKSEKHS